MLQVLRLWDSRHLHQLQWAAVDHRNLITALPMAPQAILVQSKHSTADAAAIIMDQQANLAAQVVELPMAMVQGQAAKGNRDRPTLIRGPAAVAEVQAKQHLTIKVDLEPLAQSQEPA